MRNYKIKHSKRNIKDRCVRCCFSKGCRCDLPFSCEPKSYYVRPDDCHVRIANTTTNVDLPTPPEVDAERKEAEGEAAAQQQLTERNKEGKPGIGKRSYYGFPNGVEAEDICRYLPFNLGNVVKYVCRAGRKDAKKKIEDLQKARDYLDNEIKRLEEGNE